MTSETTIVQAPSIAPVLGRFLRFALMGLCGTAVHYMVMASLVEFFSVSLLIATTVGFTAGAFVNYALNRRFTFASTLSHAVALPKFMTVAASGALINLCLVGLLTHYTPLHYILAQMVSTGTVLFWNFIVNAIWTFRR